MLTMTSFKDMAKNWVYGIILHSENFDRILAQQWIF